MNKKLQGAGDWVYLSHALGVNTPAYGGGEGPEIVQTKNLCCGDSSNAQTFRFPNHLGTHIDFPKHFFEEGHSCDAFMASDCIFNEVAFIYHKAIPGELLGPDLFKDLKYSKSCQALFIKTDFESYRGEEIYWNNNPGIKPEVANYLREFCPSLRMIGFDFISLSSYQNRDLGRMAHRAFLGTDRPILIIEDMMFNHVPVSHQLFFPFSCVIVSPLRVEKTDGTPVTVLAQYKS